jgi:hypothetical protein
MILLRRRASYPTTQPSPRRYAEMIGASSSPAAHHVSRLRHSRGEAASGSPAAGSSAGTYEALVGAVYVSHALSLATRDERALDVYRMLDVELEPLD